MNWHRAETNEARDVTPKERTKQGQASATAFTTSNREPQGIGRGPVKSIASKSKAAGSLGTETNHADGTRHPMCSHIHPDRHGALGLSRQGNGADS